MFEDAEGLIGLLVLTLLVVLFMGPGIWSSSENYPLVEFWRWLKRTFGKGKGKNPSEPSSGG